VDVYRGDDNFEEMDSASLVPGDVIVVPTGNKLMACDAVMVKFDFPLRVGSYSVSLCLPIHLTLSFFQHGVHLVKSRKY